MVDDLQSRFLRAGMPKSEVRRLLGRPDQSLDPTWAYNLDREDNFLLDTCVTLELEFTGERLQRATVRRDD